MSNLNTILIKTFHKVFIPELSFNNEKSEISDLKWSFIHTLNTKGYMPSNDLLKVLDVVDYSFMTELYNDFIHMEREIDLYTSVFYPNFPLQVMNTSENELYINAIIHYISNGTWLPEFFKIKRQYKFEPNQSFIQLDVITLASELIKLFHSVLYSKDSITQNQKSFIEVVLTDYEFPYDINEIVHKEILAIVNGINISKYSKYSNKLRFDNTTDILRCASYISDGDITLSTNTKFKSLKRKVRRLIITELETLISEEDVSRHQNKWVKLFHSLHIGEYKFAVKCNAIANKIRESVKLETFNSNVEKYIKAKNTKVFDILQTRPSEFARRLNELFIVFDEYRNEVISEFSKVISEVPNKILIQLYGLFNNYDNKEYRSIILNKSMYVYDNNTFDDKHIIFHLMNLIEKTLILNFSNNKELMDKKIYIDERLKDIPVPTGMREISEGKFTLPRGSKIDISDDNTLRFFLYWIGNDIDLSATCFDKDYNVLYDISYYDLKHDVAGCFHSGDIVSAPNGASEYIDINIDKALKCGVKYVLMSIFVYNDSPFDELKECFCGWMGRSEPYSNEIYDEKTVKQKVDVVAHSTCYHPALFDLENRKIVWMDLFNKNPRVLGNNAINQNKLIEYMITSINNINKMSLYELFCLHAKLNGVRCFNKEDADFIFDLEDGDVTVKDLGIINSEYI